LPHPYLFVNRSVDDGTHRLRIPPLSSLGIRVLWHVGISTRKPHICHPKMPNKRFCQTKQRAVCGLWTKSVQEFLPSSLPNITIPAHNIEQIPIVQKAYALNHLLITLQMHAGHCATRWIVEVLKRSVPQQCFRGTTCHRLDRWHGHHRSGRREKFFKNTALAIFFFCLWCIDREPLCS